MALKAIVIVSLVATSLGYNVGYGLASPTAPTVHVSPPLPATLVPHAALRTDPKPEDADPVMVAAYETHKAFVEKQYVKAPYHYSYGYEYYNWKTDLIERRYESRYGDVAVGTYMVHTSDGNRSVVDYTVDTPNGFFGIIRRDVLGQSANFGYGRLAGPLAYASHPSLAEYTSRTNVVDDPGSTENPLIHSAYRTHRICIDHFGVAAPFNMSWGYEVVDSHTGLKRSQYETYHGDIAEGSYTQIEADGTKSSIDYSVSPEGFAVTTPQTFSLKDNPLVQATARVAPLLIIPFK